ncbi:MAG: ABC transporter permease [Pseudomonadota bacterium]
MITYVLRRLGFAVATLVFASVLIFAVTEILPGDAAQLSLGINATDETLAAKREALGLNRSAPERYASWMAGFITGDLGRSYTYDVPVNELIGGRIWISLPLALLSLALSTLIAIPVGVWAAARRGSPVDSGIMGLTQLGIAIPNFWLALMLVVLFALTWRILPAGGFPGWDEGIWPALRALILPSIALALPQASILARVMRSSLIETMGEDYMRTARAKGLPRRAVLWRHGVRNALIPVLTIMGLQFAFLIAGTIIIENIFYIPGLGSLVFNAIRQSDLITVQSVVLMLVASVIAINLLVDIAYAIVDPRIRTARERG